MACRILVPWPGIEPVPHAMEAQSPNHWTAREFPIKDILKWNSVFLFVGGREQYMAVKNSDY